MEEESFGIMSQAYFVSKTDIIAWINKILDVDMTRIEQLGTGAILCQLVDAFYPNVVAMQRVNWKARSDYDFISNLKILQKAMSELSFKKAIDIERLSKAKYQDNLEFIQWLKKVLEGKTIREGYNPHARRNNEDLLYLAKPKTDSQLKRARTGEGEAEVDAVTRGRPSLASTTPSAAAEIAVVREMLASETDPVALVAQLRAYLKVQSLV